MSKLGNIKESYGKQINIAVANTNGENVLASTILPKNNLIIASPVDADANDIGTYAIFITDNNGTPIRLSYTIQTGNGLTTDETNGDIVKLSIDNKTLKESIDGVLYVSQEDLIDNSSLIINESSISVKTDNLNVATNEQPGIVGIDEFTIKTNQDGKIYIETENLDRANENQIGIVTSDKKTINIDSNGIINVNTNNLDYATQYSPGVIQCDGITLLSSYGNIKVNTNGLKYATSKDFGISKCDNSTITVTNGIYSVNTDNLEKCSNTNYGVAKTDGVTTITEDGVLSINNYENIVNKISTIQTKIQDIKNKVSKLSDSVADVNLISISDPTIFTFMCNAVTSVNLTKPKYGTFPDDFLSETITAEFTVNTNCPFTITVSYLDNISPNIFLYEINYDDLDKYPGDLGLYNEYQSTNCVDKILRFSWKCKNYSSSNSTESTSTRVKITISYSKDNTITKTVYYNIVRYNSLYSKDKTEKTILTANSDGTLNIDTTISVV